MVWEEKVNANSAKEFVFYAKKGQKLTLGFIDDTNQGSMDWGKVSIEPNAAPLETIIEVTKDYRLSVSNNSNKATSFRISISLEDAKSTAPAQSKSGKKETVRFAKGASSATLTRTIPTGGYIDFMINAGKGQTMNFTIGYDFDDNDVKGYLMEPGLQDEAMSTGPKKPNEFKIMKTGDHTLRVRNLAKKKVTITLYLDIE